MMFLWWWSSLKEWLIPFRCVENLQVFHNCYFFPIIFISWRLITLQYCSGFCHTLTWISHGFTCILSSVKQITSPGWMHETSARDWCTGMTQRDGMGREVGGGFRMGNTCNSYVFSIVNSISIFQISACSHVSGCMWLFLNLGFY